MKIDAEIRQQPEVDGIENQSDSGLIESGPFDSRIDMLLSLSSLAT
jgi:hypothetical protein